MEDKDVSDPEFHHTEERNSFIFLAVLLAPIVSIIIVGGYGFLVWIYQLIMGPPST